MQLVKYPSSNIQKYRSAKETAPELFLSGELGFGDLNTEILHPKHSYPVGRFRRSSLALTLVQDLYYRLAGS